MNEKSDVQKLTRRAALVGAAVIPAALVPGTLGEDKKQVEAPALVRSFVDALDNAFGTHDISELVNLYKDRYPSDEPATRATSAHAFHDAMVYAIRTDKKQETIDLLSDYFDSEMNAVRDMFRERGKDLEVDKTTEA